jgi:hypothetical protein
VAVVESQVVENPGVVSQVAVSRAKVDQVTVKVKVVIT